MATMKAVVHGVSQGVISEIRGGDFKTSFMSGFITSGFSVGNSGYGNAISRTAIMAIVGGTVSEIGGGKFANGARTAVFVHLFNAESMGQKFTSSMIESYYSLKGWMFDNVTMIAGETVSFHALIAGGHVHHNEIDNSTAICCRIGPGMLGSAGVEVGGSIGFSENSSNWSFGVGGDIAYMKQGVGGSFLVNDSSFAAARGWKGLGFSFGVDGCYTFK